MDDMRHDGTSQANQSDENLDNNESIELTQCKAERDAYKEKTLRVQADFENFTKRSEKERISWKTAAQAGLLIDILPIVDDFDRALAEQKTEFVAADMQKQREGFAMIAKAFYKFLEKYDVREIPASMPFDPEYHEAIVQIESSDHTSGQIVAVLQKGFTFKGQVLRPAKVSVAK